MDNARYPINGLFRICNQAKKVQGVDLILKVHDLENISDMIHWDGALFERQILATHKKTESEVLPVTVSCCDNLVSNMIPIY